MKRRFEFRLARVKRVREIEEDVARATWLAAEAEAASAAAERDRLRSHIAQERAWLAATRPDPAEVLLHYRLLSRLLSLLRGRKERSLTLRAQADRLAGSWRQRERERRALVELEGRKRQRHVMELRRLENLEMDEIAIHKTPKGESHSRRTVLPSD